MFVYNWFFGNGDKAHGCCSSLERAKEFAERSVLKFRELADLKGYEWRFGPFVDCDWRFGEFTPMKVGSVDIHPNQNYVCSISIEQLDRYPE